MIDRFLEMLTMQAELQLSMKDGDPRQLADEKRTAFLQWNAFALTDELHEAMQEVGWKPWATSNHVNEAAFMKEMVDAFHFFMNMLLAGTGYENLDELATAFTAVYMAKNAENRERQEKGYDGLKDKCPICRRELLIPTPSAGKMKICPEHGPQGEVLS